MAISAGEIEMLLKARDEATADVTKAMASIRREVEKVGPLAEGAFGKVGQAASAAGQAMTAAGAAMTAAITVPIVGALSLSTRAAMDFESSFANVRKTVDASEPEFAAMSAGIRQMAKDIPATTTELNNIAAIGGQFGISKTGLLEFTRTVADLGVAVDGISAENAAAQLAQISAVTNTSEKEFRNLASTLVDLGNKGNSTEAMILEMTARIAGAGHTIGLTQPQIFGIGAAMANLGINAEAGGSAMSRTFAEIDRAVAKGGGELEGFARTSRMSAEDFATTFKNEPIKAIQAFIGGLQKTVAEGGNLTLTLDALDIKELRQVDTLKRLASSHDGINKSLVDAERAYRENSALTEEAAKKYETFENQLKLFKNEVTDVGITLGTSLMPTLRGLLADLRPVVDLAADGARKFAELPQPVREAGLAIAGAGALAGPATLALGGLLMTVGQLANPNTIAGLTLLANGLKAVGVAALASTPYLLGLAAAVGGVYGAYKIAEQSYGLWLDKQERGKSVQAEQQRQQAMIAEATRIAGREIGTYAEAVKIVTGHIRAQVDEQERASVVYDKAAGPYQETANATADLAKQLAEAKRQVQNLTPAQRENIAAGVQMGLSVKEIANNLRLTEPVVEIYKDAVAAAAKAAHDKTEKLKKLNEEMTKFGKLNMSLHDAIEAGAFGKLVTDLGKAPPLFSETNDLMGLNILQAGELAKGWKKANDSLDHLKGSTGLFRGVLDNLGETIVKAFQGGGNVLQSIGGTVGLQIGNNVVESFGKHITGFLGKTLGGAVNSLIPGLGTLLGPLLSKVGSFFKNLFGGIPKEVQEARAAVDAFQKSLAATLTDQQRAEAGGEQWKMTVIAVRDAYLATGRTAAEAEAIVRQLWDTDHPARAKAAIEEVNRVLGLVKSDQEQLNAAVQRYGFTLEELGPTMQRQRLSEMAQQLITDYNLLVGSGISVEAVTRRMGDAINEYVASALRTGQEVPIAMKPILEAMIEQGRLTDANGEKLTSLEGLTFSETLTQGVNRIVEAIDKLTGAIGGDLPRAATGAARTIENEFRNRALPALHDTAEAVNEVIEMHSPTGLEGIAYYAHLAGIAIGDDMAGRAVPALTKMRGVIDESGQGVRKLVTICGEEFPKLGKGIIDGFQVPMATANKQLTEFLDKVGKFTGGVPLDTFRTPSGETPGPFEGFVKPTIETISEAEAIARARQVAALYGVSLSDADLASLAQAYGYGGGGRISKGRLDSFLQDLSRKYVEQKYTGFANGSGGFIDFGAGTPTMLHGVEKVETLAQAADDAAMIGGLWDEVARLREGMERRDRSLPHMLAQALRDQLQLGRRNY